MCGSFECGFCTGVLIFEGEENKILLFMFVVFVFRFVLQIIFSLCSPQLFCITMNKQHLQERERQTERDRERDR